MVTAELRGLRILVTRAAGQARPLSSLLKAAGADVVTAPLIAFEPVGDSAALRRGIREWARYDHVVFTSANAVRAFAAAAGYGGNAAGRSPIARYRGGSGRSRDRQGGAASRSYLP